MTAIVANTGSNNWNTNGAWAGGVQPTAADDVTIPASAVVTIPTATTALARSVTVAALGTVAFASTTAILNIGDGTAGAGNVALSISTTATITLTGIGTINFISTSATQQTITSGGKTLPNWTVNGVAGNYLLSDANTTGPSTTVTLTNGTLNTGSQTCVWGNFQSSNANTRVLTLGSSSITLQATGAAWSNQNPNGLTITANTATVTFTGSNAQFDVGGTVNYNGLSLVSTGPGLLNFNRAGGNPTFAALDRIGTATKADSISLAHNINITGILTITGNSAVNRLMVVSSIVGTARTITAGAIALTNVGFMDIIGAGLAGNASWTGTLLGDGLGNSNITFESPLTLYRVGAGGNWSDSNWSLTSGGATGQRVPLSQDSVNVDGNASGTITADMPRMGRNINFTGFTGTWGNTSTGTTVFGNLTLASGMTLIGASAVTLGGRSAQTLTSNGKVFSGAVSVIAPGGTYVLQDAFSGTRLIATTTMGAASTFDANNFNVTLSDQTAISSSQSNATWNMGSGTWSLTSTIAAVIWNFSAGTINPGTHTILIANATANSRTFAGGGKTYGTLNYTVAGSTGTLVITGANTFAGINFSDVMNARTLTLPSGTITTITPGGWSVNGTAGKLMTVNSSIPGTPHIISIQSGVVSSDYLSISDSTALGGAGYSAGINSTLSNTQGWALSYRPSSPYNLLRTIRRM